MIQLEILTTADAERLHSEVAQLKRDLKTKEKLLRLAVNLRK